MAMNLPQRPRSRPPAQNQWLAAQSSSLIGRRACSSRAAHLWHGAALAGTVRPGRIKTPPSRGAAPFLQDRTSECCHNRTGTSWQRAFHRWPPVTTFPRSDSKPSPPGLGRPVASSHSHDRLAACVAIVDQCRPGIMSAWTHSHCALHSRMRVPSPPLRSTGAETSHEKAIHPTMDHGRAGDAHGCNAVKSGYRAGRLAW